ncbi:hypothetical protein L249_4672 [Ophiocordyceps polyrhachis-furcata BCC 54312]|uniref:SRCR domain-containing protein n=1 Tax=Ophiocordyceps polyrhachis-furcata BCC 54312 TaxID=1330021 RepID=A0A367L303_9HYPO|nr:hypothetical protein L249_4672 [Ophiocordyceps polyrhachis-furcata BCC 54312]
MLPPPSLYIISTLIAFLAACRANRPPGERSRYVFRGDSRTPDQIRNATGFLPRSNTNYNEPVVYSLFHHALGLRLSTAYVSTSARFGQAAVNFAGSGNYVYRIHVTPNMINVNEVLNNSSPYPTQDEASALGGIPWSAVQGWWYIPIPGDGEPDSLFDQWCLNDVAAYNLTARYETEYEHLFTPNPEYQGERYDGAMVQTSIDADVAVLASTNPDTVLSDLRNAATRFMERRGSTVGWTRGQGFPLWEPVPGSAEPTQRRYEADESSTLLTDDDLLDIAGLVHHGDAACLEAPPPSPVEATVLDDLGDDLASLRERVSPSERQDRALQEAEGVVRRTVGACVMLTTCVSLQQGLPPYRRKRRELARLTPGLNGLCSKFSGPMPWQYGGDFGRLHSTVCQNGFDHNNVSFPLECERLIGTELYCNRLEDEDACLSKRRPPPFRAAGEGPCTPIQKLAMTENCIGTERWCSDEVKGTYRAIYSTVTAEECLLRRSSGQQPSDVATTEEDALTCSKVDGLKVGFSIGPDGFFTNGGTYDTIVFSIGRFQIVLAEAPSKGTSVSRSVNLEVAFGSKAVPLADIKHVRLLDIPPNNLYGGDEWHFQGKETTCHGSSKVMEMKKFQSVHTWLQNRSELDMEEVWSGDIQPQDWRQLEPKSPPTPAVRHDEMRRFVDYDDMQKDGNADHTGTTADWTEIEMPLDDDDDDDDDDDEASEAIDCKASAISWDFFDRQTAKVASGELACRHPSRRPQATMRWLQRVNLERCEVVDNGAWQCSSWPATSSLPDSVIKEAAEYGIPSTTPPRAGGVETIDCLKAGIGWDKKNRETRRIVSGIDDCGRRDRPGQTWRWWLGKHLVECRNKGNQTCEVHQPKTMTDEAKARAREFGIPTEEPPSEEQDRELWRGPWWKRFDCRGMSWNDGNERTRLVAIGKAVCDRADDPNWLWRWKGGRQLVECRIKPIKKEYRCFYHDAGNLTAEVKARADRFFIPTTIPPAGLLE